MKLSVIVPLLTLAIGLAIGWVAKPTPKAPEANIAQTDSPKISTRKEPGSKPPAPEKEAPEVTPSVRVVQAEAPDEMPEDQKAEMEKYQSQFGEMMKKNQKRQLDARISKLVSQLKLSPEQEAALRKALEENQLDPASIMSGDFDPSKLAELTGDGALEDALADILTDEQKAENEALKERELANKIESKALKSLARLSDLDMTQEQKDAAYDILYQQAEESAGKESATNGIFTAITGGMGLNIDVDDIGIDFDEISEATAESVASGEVPDQGDIMARMRENQQRKIDAKVEALRPVLNEDQLTQYRESLEINRGGILGGLLDGLGTEESSDE